MIGIICPSEFEFRALKRSGFKENGATLILSGMGKVRALYACARLHRECPTLKAILLVGFAGGLTPDLKVGDIIEPQVFIEQDYCAEPFEKFPNIIRHRGKLLGNSMPATILTQDRFLKENPYGTKASARRRMACDMESYSVAYYCKTAKIGLGVVKLISDSADPNADHDFLKACRRLSGKLTRTAQKSLKRLRSLYS